MNDFLPYISLSINDTISSLEYFYPELLLVAGFLLIILADLFFAVKYKNLTFWLALLVIAGSGWLTYAMSDSRALALFGGMIVIDKLALLLKLLLCLVSIIFLVFVRYNKALMDHTKGIGDLYSILIAVHLALNLMVMSSNLLMIYISLEMVSVGSYLLVGYLCRDARQSEAALKYALFGAICSACMLYGMSLLYAFSGTLDISDPAFVQGLLETSPLASGLAIILTLVGVAFKLALVPFHFWSPDVYEGAPTPVTAFLSTGPKIAGFALLVRLIIPFQALSFGDSISLNAILAAAGIACMIVGNFGAIWQNNVKRMLAYSSIGHTGFMLMAVFILSESSFKALLFYLAVYAIMNMAAFIIADEIEERTGATTMAGYRGLGKPMALPMAVMVIVLISLTGLPPTVGFTAKFLVFSAALESYRISGSSLLMALIITGAVSTLVSLFYYFKIPLNAFLREDAVRKSVLPASPKAYLGISLALILIVLIVFPSLLEQFL